MSSVHSHHYNEVKNKKQRFEESMAAFLSKKRKPQRENLVSAFSELFSTLEVFATDIESRLPSGYISTKTLYSDDFLELLDTYISFVSSSSKNLPNLFSVPRNKDFLCFIRICFLFMENDNVKKYCFDLKQLSLPCPDMEEIGRLKASISRNFIDIPSSANLSDGNFYKLNEFFIKNQKKTVLFLGSGGSISVTSPKLPEGMPSWKELVLYMLEEAKNAKNFNNADYNSLLQEINQGNDLLKIASKIQKKYATYWEDSLEKLFELNVVSNKIKNPHLYSLLHELPFVGRMTTNYDSLYEKINNVKSISNYHKAFLKWTANKWSTPMVKLHGCVDNGDDLIITSDDYRRMYNAENINQIANVFRQYDVLFVGFGANDPYLVKILGDVTEQLKGFRFHDRRYFGFFEDNISSFDLEELKRYNINPILYPEKKHIYQVYYIQKLLENHQEFSNQTKLSFPQG